MMDWRLLNVFLPLLTFGGATAFLGAIKLPLAQRLTLNDAQIARWVSLIPLANLVGTLVAGYWLVGISYQLVIVGGFLGIITALLLFSQAKTALLLKIAIISLGLGGSWLNLGSNALLPVLVPNNPASITNLAHACFGLGALSLPVILSYLWRRFRWNHAIFLVAVLVLIPSFFAFFLSYPPSYGAIIAGIGANLLFHPVMSVAMLVSLCYVGIEASIGIWTTTYLNYVGWEELTASSLVSLFWLGLMGGRLIIGLIVTPDNSFWVIRMTILSLLATLVLMTRFRKPWVGLVAIVMLGLSCAALFPTLVGWLFTQFDPRLSGTIYAMMSVSAMIGYTLIPFLVGNVSARWSIIRGFQLLIIPTSCLLLLSFGLP